jgi:hypothetical protein
VCSFAIKIATLLDWSAGNWVNALSLLATVMLGLSVVDFFACLFWCDISERRPKLDDSGKMPRPRDGNAETVKRKGGKIRFTDRRRPTSGFKW